MAGWNFAGKPGEPLVRRVGGWQDEGVTILVLAALVILVAAVAAFFVLKS